MAELIAIPLKKPSDVDVVKPLTNVIRSTYSGTGKDYVDAIAEFSKLRNNALWRAFEKYESSLQVIYRYESSLSIIISIICVRWSCRMSRALKRPNGTSAYFFRRLSAPSSYPVSESEIGDEQHSVRPIYLREIDNEGMSRAFPSFYPKSETEKNYELKILRYS